jgi:hypothetical protein
MGDCYEPLELLFFEVQRGSFHATECYHIGIRMQLLCATTFQPLKKGRVCPLKPHVAPKAEVGNRVLGTGADLVTDPAFRQAQPFSQLIRADDLK